MFKSRKNFIDICTTKGGNKKMWKGSSLKITSEFPGNCLF